MVSATRPISHEARVAQTQHLILDAALALFAERGVDGTTVSAIIDRSAVSRATFYRHFQDLDDVLNSALQRDFHLLLGDFEAQRYEHAQLEAQIVDDFVWFVRRLSSRPALALLFADASERVHRLARQSLGAFRGAGLACARPTYERAKAEGRLREAVTLEEYVDWATFVVTSLQQAQSEFAGDELRLRSMLEKFFVPSLIR